MHSELWPFENGVTQSPDCTHDQQQGESMVQCHICQMWIHVSGINEGKDDIVGSGVIPCQITQCPTRSDPDFDMVLVTQIKGIQGCFLLI